MSAKKQDVFRSSLAQVRGLGSAHDGTHHWWMQRITAIALIPLSLWFVTSLICCALYSKPEKVAEWLSNPLSSVGLVGLAVALFYHAKLGIQVVIEDYVTCRMARPVLLVLNSFFCIAAAAITVLAVIKLHLIAPVSYL
jgi:succinate dehydrogenase / fumarate reductase, membrane anchor subunit